jgi:hypothetical protein
MSYIGVPPQYQENFHNRVIEAQKDFKDNLYPTTKESYWATVDYHYSHIKTIVLMYTSISSDMLDVMVKDRNISIIEVFNKAWANAPDTGEIHLLPAWYVFCDLCSESYLILEP